MTNTISHTSRGYAARFRASACPAFVMSAPAFVGTRGWVTQADLAIKPATATGIRTWRPPIT